MTRRIRITLLTIATLVTLTALAIARPGGGESFSGGGGHSGGGSGGGGGAAVFYLIWYGLQLCIYYPYIGLPIIALIVGAVIYGSISKSRNRDWESGPPVVLERATSLERVREIDPEFSQVPFEDFAFRLFSTAQRARATEATRATIAPYVSPNAQVELARREPVGTPVTQVIVGAMRPYRVDVPRAATDADGKPTRVRIGIEFEANVLTGQHTYYSVESWLFARDATRHSKPPGRAKDFPCPNCGAPWQASATGTQVCASCNQVVDNGRFDWVVEEISVASIDERPPSLTTEVPERGNDLATYRDDGVDEDWAALTTDDPAVTEGGVEARLKMIYDAMNKAWSTNALEPIRGFVSDGLYDYLQYWVDAYKRQGLRNQLTDMRVTSIELAKVQRDKYYDAVTLRVFATGKDFVVKTDTGQLMRGSKNRERPYSEYWTLIRSAGRKGAPHIEPTCGNCGAPLKITMAGSCEHCGAHVTAGEFDWVLSKIEQDDTYRG